jgi:uncharacterized protein (TIGR02246 family)
MAASGVRPSEDGKVSGGDGRYTLQYERLLQHPIEAVWRALTEPYEIAGWLAEAEIDPVVGGRMLLHWLNGDTTARGTVTRYDPPRLLEFDTDIHGRLRWQLEPATDGCLLRFTVDVALSDDHLISLLAGWHVHLDFLGEALDGRRIDWPNWPLDRWQALYDRYAAREGAAMPDGSAVAMGAADAAAVRALCEGIWEAWNRRDAEGYAGLFAEDALVIGFDGSTMHGLEEIRTTIGAIFRDHPTAAYTGIVHAVRPLAPDVALLEAVAGMTPPGRDTINPAVNAVQTLVAARYAPGWRVASFQNTPAQFHGRPELAQRLTDELQQAARLRAAAPA